MRKFGMFLASLILIFTNMSAHASSTGPAFASPDGRQVPKGYWQYFFTPAHLLPMSYIGGQFPDTPKDTSAVLPPCDGKQTACISTVEYSINGANWETATPGPDLGQRSIAFGTLTNFNTWNMTLSSTFPEDLSIGRPEGSTPRMWTMNHAPHAGGNQYQISVQLSGPTGNPNSFMAQVIPAVQIPAYNGACMQPGIFSELRDKQIGLCLTAYDFPEKMRVRITVKLGSFLSSLAGWFDGRLEDPTIKIDTQTQTVTIEGNPTIVPSTAIEPIKYEDIPANFELKPSSQVINVQNQSNSGTAGMGSANTAFDLKSFITMSKYIKERALGENTVWRITSMPNFQNAKCLQPGLVNGIVLTNATVYDASPPTWNSRDASLDFKVAASHFISSGDIFRGYYSLLINEKVARCYWGDDFAHGTATINITNQDGTPNVATTNMGIRDGWVNFLASGFSFSSPTISAKIVPAPKIAPSKTPTPVPLPSQSPVAIKKTLICSKGKTVRKVVGINPQCPTGYKKKI